MLVTMLLWCNSPSAMLDGLQGPFHYEKRISSYACSALTTMQLRSYYNLMDGAAPMLCLCCPLKLLLCNSSASRGSASTDHQPSNKMHNVIIPVTMINLAVMNHRLHKACLLLRAVHSQRGASALHSEGGGSKSLGSRTLGSRSWHTSPAVQTW